MERRHVACAEFTDELGRFSLHRPLAPPRIPLVEEFVDEGVEDVGNGVDGDVAVAAGITTDGLATRFTLFQTPLPDPSEGELSVDVVQSVDHSASLA